MGFSVGLLNNIRANASEDYQNRIPEATQENFQSIGFALQTYTTLRNEYCESLWNKIGKTKLESKLFKNKLAKYKSGSILTAQDVEEIFVEMATAEGAYDPTGPNPLGRRNPSEVKTQYHRRNRQDYYVISLGDLDFRRVFQSEATHDAFVTAQINSIYSGASYDEWLAMKNLLASYDGYATVDTPMIGGWIETDPEALVAEKVTTENGAKMFVKQLRKVIRDLSFANTNYNSAGVRTWTDPGDLVLLVHKDLVEEVDVEVLSKAFNMGKTDIPVQIEVMDDFGDLTNTYAILCDKDFFRVYDTLSHMEPQRNAQGLFTNYFYHIHQILSLSRFKQAVRFVAIGSERNPYE